MPDDDTLGPFSGLDRLSAIRFDLEQIEKGRRAQQAALLDAWPASESGHVVHKGIPGPEIDDIHLPTTTFGDR